MLMRSSSTSALNSWGSQPSHQPLIPISKSSQPMHINHEQINKISRNVSESDLTRTTSCCMHTRFLPPVEDEEVGPVDGRGGGDWSGGGASGGSGGGDANNGSGSMDVYYQSMIEANPGNSMLLSNYAIYLKEIRGDIIKAEEYCGRAILANPNDGSVLSFYGELIWQTYEDAQRAQIYFDRAVKAEPDNCDVMASYARFLWDAEDESECPY